MTTLNIVKVIQIDPTQTVNPQYKLVVSNTVDDLINGGTHDVGTYLPVTDMNTLNQYLTNLETQRLTYQAQIDAINAFNAAKATTNES